MDKWSSTAERKRREREESVDGAENGRDSWLYRPPKHDRRHRMKEALLPTFIQVK